MCFANGGYRVEPYYIDRIEDIDGNVVYQATATVVPTTEITDSEPNPGQAIQTTQRPAERVVDERNIWLMNSITQDVIQHGTGRRALSLGRKRSLG